MRVFFVAVFLANFGPEANAISGELTSERSERVSRAYFENYRRFEGLANPEDRLKAMKFYPETEEEEIQWEKDLAYYRDYPDNPGRAE